jgi:hypothetical protein
MAWVPEDGIENETATVKVRELVNDVWNVT